MKNMISQMLVSKGVTLYFYTRYNEDVHRNDIEIDFLLSNDSKTNFKINPIEVKSGKNYTTTSLTAFHDVYKKRIDKQWIIHPKNLLISDGIIKIPPYMVWNAI